MHIRAAILEIRRLPKTRLVRLSSIYETSPVGKRDQRRFLNCCAEIRTSLSPMGLLVELKRIEALCGRDPGPRWGPRPLDIDILFYGRARLAKRLLTIPHPRALQRRFVLAPLAEMHPHWAPPISPRVTLDRRLREALRVRLNDPAQNVTLYAALSDGKSLRWTRSRRPV